MSVPTPSDLTLWYSESADEWTKALPVGNGRLGAMVFGGVGAERLQLNEDTLWAGGPHDPVNPASRKAIPRVRNLIAQGKYEQAEALADEAVMAVPLKQAPYQCLGDLQIEFFDADGTPLMHDAGTYRRSLDLRTACAETVFASGGVQHRRAVLVSPEHQVIAANLGSDQPAQVHARVSLTSPLQQWTVAATGDELLLHASNDEHRGIPGALDVVARVHIRVGSGTVQAEEQSILISDADNASILIAAGTSYLGPKDTSGDPFARTREWVDATANVPFEQIAEATERDHRALFDGFDLELGPVLPDVPTDERIERAQTSNDPGLAALYLQFARYLLICSSRPGSQPANLQGIWNESTSPPWGSKYTVNINTEMNYWPAHATGLGACTEPLERLIREVAVTGAQTAKQMYGARGWVLHHNTDLWRSTAPIDGARFGLWPTGGAWLCTHLWERYLHDGDPNYLESIYPILRDASLFFLDTLQQHEPSGYLVTSPSTSPENRHPHGSPVVAGPSMDSQILRDLFEITASAAAILERDDALRQQLDGAQERLAPDRVGAQGQLQEWMQDWDSAAPEPHHRHTSHLYALYPSRQISPERTPELAAGARRSLESRGVESTGWATAWRISLWARLRDGERADTMLRLLLKPGLTYPNMFDAHPPFQIDGNFGGAAGIVEMLVQHDGEVIDLLPALPSAWPQGSLTGVRLPGGLTLDLTWQERMVAGARLLAARDCVRTVRFDGNVHEVELAAGQSEMLIG